MATQMDLETDTTTQQTPESASRRRTRAAILDAAARVFGERREATLADVATAAGVGRSTLHRYFPERDQLIDALAEHLIAQIAIRLAEAKPDEGPPVEALSRVLNAYLDLGPLISIIWNEPRLADRKAFWESFEQVTAPTYVLLQRGQACGDFETQSPIEWLGRAFWGLLYSGIEAGFNERVMTRHEVHTLLLRFLLHGISAQRPSTGTSLPE